MEHENEWTFLCQGHHSYKTFYFALLLEKFQSQNVNISHINCQAHDRNCPKFKGYYGRSEIDASTLIERKTILKEILNVADNHR